MRQAQHGACYPQILDTIFSCSNDLRDEEKERDENEGIRAGHVVFILCKVRDQT